MGGLILTWNESIIFYMSILDYLFFLFIEPLKLIFEFVFFCAYKYSGNIAVSIVAVSLVINFLVLPLYKHADELEEQQREKKRFMKPYVDRIKSAFKGDERVMILQAYYRENNYGLKNVFMESVSLFLQIPFFIAAYNFLSNLTLLKGISLWAIRDLGAPDNMFNIGGFAINVLPILMTLINILSGFIYTSKEGIKDKIRIILIAAVFLVLLYDSPAGLVFYWTLNNVFSLAKNIVTHIAKSKKTAKAEKPAKKPILEGQGSFAMIMLSGAVFTILTGVMIPSDVIAKNPTELIKPFGMNACNPVMYLLSSGLIAAGVFMIWIPLFVFLTKEKTLKVLTFLLPAVAVAGLINYVVFNRNFGNLSKKLIYEYPMGFTIADALLNLLIYIVLIGVFAFAFYKMAKYRKLLVGVILFAVVALSGLNIATSLRITAGHSYTYSNTAEEISVPMTTTGQNVVVIMMDRMINGYIPCIVKENPEVAEKFDGFVYYPNTVSLGHSTNNGAPAIFGGYEYSPVSMNARDTELLVDKHNEALKVLPTVFANNGWKVTVGDPPYANYEWIPDVSIYDDNPAVTAYNFNGVLTGDTDIVTNLGEEYEVRLNRNLFCYGLMKISPYILQPTLYTSGSYNDIDLYTAGTGNIGSFADPAHTQIGYDESYLESRCVLESLDDIVEVTDSSENCFFMFANNTTHDICLLDEPSYAPSYIIDNTEYDEANADRFNVDGRTVHMEDYLSYAHYECAMSACILLGNWFDYLRANGLYDNTRIIIVADHGYDFGNFDELVLDDIGFDVEHVYPVLLVKDFNATGFTTCDDFMTNADTPTLALSGVVDSPVNPFTGNPINMDSKAGDQYIYISGSGDVLAVNGTKFDEDDHYWLAVHDNIFVKDNWSKYQGEPG